MGGEPLTALSIVGFPSGKLPLEVLTEIVRGGQDKVHEAGAVLVGGHTIIDEELKFGLSVTGRVHPREVITNATARPGDRLVLTKPLGTGLVATAVKRGVAPDGAESAMIESMCRLNRDAARAAVRLGLTCGTDVTGFGLLGHASHIARASGVTLHIDPARLPRLPGVPQILAAGITTGGAERNVQYLQPITAGWASVAAADIALLVDPQTSGGLLLACAEARLPDYLSAVPEATVVGYVAERGEHLLVLE